MIQNKKLTNYEKERLMNLSHYFKDSINNTLFIHDLENTLGYYFQSKDQSKQKFKNNLQDFDKHIGVEKSDLAIISANANLLENANKLHYKISPSPEILFPASGKDGADLKLIESINFLEVNNILSRFKDLVIISGDKIFYRYILSLQKKGYKIRSFSLKQTTANVYDNLADHNYVNLKFKNKKKRKKSNNKNYDRNNYSNKKYNPQFEKLKEFVFEPKVA